MKCNKCGTINEDSAKVCVKCLSPLNAKIQSNVSLNGGVDNQTENLVNGLNQETNTVSNNVVNEQIMDTNSQNSVNNKIDNSIIRRSIKKDARKRKKGPVIASYIILVVLTIAIYGAIFFFTVQNLMNQFNQTIIQTDQNFSLYYLVYIIIAIVEFFLIFVMARASLEVSRDNKISVGKAFGYATDNIGNMLMTFGVYILFIIALVIIEYVLLYKLAIPVIFGIIILIASLLYFIPVLSVYLFLSVDDIDSKDLKTGRLNKCMELVKGHRVEYFALLLSFIGWFLLATLGSSLIGAWLVSGLKDFIVSISGIIYAVPLMYLVMLLPMLLFSIWVVSYVQISLANWYRYINKEAEYKGASEGITNELLIALVILFYVIIFAVQFIG